MALELGGSGTSTILLYGDRPGRLRRSAFVNGAFAHACDLDEYPRRLMHHPGASVLPAVLAMAEREDTGGRELLEAAICGYEASLRMRACGTARNVPQGVHGDADLRCSGGGFGRG